MLVLPLSESGAVVHLGKTTQKPPDEIDPVLISACIPMPNYISETPLEHDIKVSGMEKEAKVSKRSNTIHCKNSSAASSRGVNCPNFGGVGLLFFRDVCRNALVISTRLSHTRYFGAFRKPRGQPRLQCIGAKQLLGGSFGVMLLICDSLRY